MAKGDDKTRGRDSGDENRPSGKPAGDSGLVNRSDPFDEDPPIRKKPPPKKEPAPKDEGPPPDREPRRRRPSPPDDAGASADREPATAEPEAPRQSRFGFRRRALKADDVPDDPRRDAGRRVASLEGDNLGDDDLADLPEPPRFRRPPWWALVAGFVLVLIVSSALYGEFNTERYFLVCSGSDAEAHRGRGFPWPFGHQRLVGSQYRPLSLGGDTQCQTQELDSESELRHALLRLLLTEAERLAHKTRSGDLARARRLVNQGALLAKNHKKERQRLEALRAVLDFAQARGVMRELETTLGDARRLFTKARRRKQHDKEAAAWIGLLDRMLDQLRRRAAGDPQPPQRVGAPPAAGSVGGNSPPPSRPVVPQPGKGTPDAKRPGSQAPPRTVPLAAPDAGVAGGGILL